jgi:xylulokinase
VVDPVSAGAFVGMRNTATRGDMFRAVVEGLSYQFREILDGLESGLGQKAERVVAVGGGTKNRFAMQNKADVSGTPIEASEVEEATPLGAAILAGIGVGIYQDESDALAQVRRPGVNYEPNVDLAPLYDKGYETFKLLYPALREVNGRLQQQA